MNVLGLQRRILTRFLQTFNSKSPRRSHRAPAAWTVPLPTVHGKEFDAVAEVLRPVWKTMLVHAEGFILIRSLWFGTPVSPQPSVELEVPQCAEFLLGRGRSEPERGELRRVWSMSWTIGPSRRVVYIAALQHVIFNADSTIIERMIRDRTGLIILSVLTSMLDEYVLQWMKEDAFDGHCGRRRGFPKKSELILCVSLGYWIWYAVILRFDRPAVCVPGLQAGLLRMARTTLGSIASLKIRLGSSPFSVAPSSLN